MIKLDKKKTFKEKAGDLASKLLGYYAGLVLGIYLLCGGLGAIILLNWCIKHLTGYSLLGV